ncbi:MAG TPA: hypothetical protein VKB26_12915 [Candidatus Acidoferrales bacterium]|nr:hypothetical protein [Candidatus Acidoferrales bacterium]
MPYVAPKNPWYTFFFGVRGLLRLFAMTLALGYAIFFYAKIGDSGPIIPRIAEAASIAAARTEVLAMVTGLFSIALWFGLHSSIEPGFLGFHRIFSEECEDYDWWGRRISNRGK